MYTDPTPDGYAYRVNEYPESGLLRSVRLVLASDRSGQEGEEAIADHPELTRHLRRLREVGRRPGDDSSLHRLQWGAVPPEGAAQPHELRQPQANDPTLVLDTNHFLELLALLPADGGLTGVPKFPPRLAEAAVRLYRELLGNIYGAAGRFIVPLVVLEESMRVARRDPSRFGPCVRVLRAIEDEPEEPLWNVFRFEALTQDVFECYMQLQEALSGETNVPGLADMVILAHGLYNGCPVASEQWHTRRDEWRCVKSCYPYLVL